MSFAFTNLPALLAEGFECIIDTRSPSEYAIDHLPGAVSMPVLSDEERAHVGTVYKQIGPFQARRIGGAMVARNTAAHIETFMQDKPGGWRPLVYCWRGGQRSNAFATILRQIGWRVEVLEGGYRTWRRHVTGALYDRALPFRAVRLDGFTGTAKTDILRRAGEIGAQVLDLEGLARHRGSILGDVEGDQPAQKLFESRIMAALAGFDPALPVLVEAESARIGDLRLPPAIWGAMKGSGRIVVSATQEARARYLAAQYEPLTDRPAALVARLDRLRHLVGHEVVDQWNALLQAGRFQALALGLIADHYDPAYGRLRRADEGEVLAELSGGALAPADIDRVAQKVVARLT